MMNQERVDEIAAECASLFGPQTPAVTIRLHIARAINVALSEDGSNENTRLLAATFRLAMEPLRGVATRSGNRWRCRECDQMAPTKLDVRHAPGCILWGVPREKLAALEGFEIEAGESV